MALGKNIKIYRDRQGLTLAQLSDISGVELGTIGALEVRDSVRSKYASAIAKALGMTMEQLEADVVDVSFAPPIDRPAAQTQEEITIPEAKDPDDGQPPGLYAVEQRTVARPPMTDEEYDLLDGYRLADETDQKTMLGLALIAKSRKGHRDGERQKKA